MRTLDNEAQYSWCLSHEIVSWLRRTPSWFHQQVAKQTKTASTFSGNRPPKELIIIKFKEAAFTQIMLPMGNDAASYS